MEQKLLFQKNMENLMIEKYENLRAAYHDRNAFMAEERNQTEC